MLLTDKKVGVIHYTLKDGSGAVIDTSDGHEPLAFLFGAGNIIPGLEAELMGKSVGDKVTAVISPENAYGERDDNLVQEVPMDNFDDASHVQPGAQFQAEAPDGSMHIGTVVNVEDGTATIDLNHPLAGTTLHFDVEVVEVREATAEELEHGHIHGPDCQH